VALVSSLYRIDRAHYTHCGGCSVFAVSAKYEAGDQKTCGEHHQKDHPKLS